MRKPELGKYLLWSLFAKNQTVRSYLPDTRRFSKDSFRTLLERVGMVYVKPSGGSRGMGVIKVWRSGGRVYVKHTVRKTKSFGSVTDAFLYLDKQRSGKAYIVQRGIQLAKVNGRPFDIRVMMQRTTPGGEWSYSGMLAKVAGPSSVVTNVALSKGYVLEVRDALKKSLGWSASKADRHIEEMKRLGKIAAKHFDSYQRYRELGFDMAVDQRGKIWMIEQNTAPSHPLFHHLSQNLSMYRRIEYRYGQYSRAIRAHSKGHVNKR